MHEGRDFKELTTAFWAAVLLIPFASAFVYAWNASCLNNVEFDCSRDINACYLKTVNIFNLQKLEEIPLSGILAASRDFSYSVTHDKDHILKGDSGEQSFVINFKDGKSMKLYRVKTTGMVIDKDVAGIDYDIKRFNEFLSNSEQGSISIKYHNDTNEDYSDTVDVFMVAFVVTYPVLLIGGLIGGRKNPLNKFVFTKKFKRRKKKEKKGDISRDLFTNRKI